MKKLLAIISAITLCTSCFSCSGKKNDKKSSGASSEISGEAKPDAEKLSAVKLTDVAYKKKAVELPKEMSMIYTTMPYNNGENYLILGSGKKSPQFWKTDRDFSQFTDVDFPDFDIGVNYNICLLNDGSAVTFVASVDYGGLPAPDPESPDYDAAVYEEAAEYTFRIYTYAPDGSILTQNDVTEFHTAADATAAMENIASDGKIVVVTINGAYEVFTIDGVYIGELTVGEEESVETIGSDRDGNIIAAVRTGEETVQFRKVLPDGKTEEADLTYNFPETVYYDIVPGSDEYKMYVSSLSTIYGIKTDNNIESLFSLNAAALNSSNFSDFIVNSEGKFIIPIREYSTWSVSAKTYTQCTPEELKNLPTITIGSFHQNDTLAKIAEEFNDEATEYRVEVKHYQDSIQTPAGFDPSDETQALALDKKVRDENERAKEELRQDALDNNLPDIILTENFSTSFGNIDLLEMDVLCDMYEFMDKDSEFTRDSVVPKILDTVNDFYDDHLYILPCTFSVHLNNVAKTKFVKDIKELDVDTYLDLLVNESEILANGEEKTSTISERKNNIQPTHWVDFDKAECYFDSDDFLHFLEYINDGEPDVEQEYISPEEWTEEDHYRNFIRQQNEFVEDYSLLGTVFIHDYSSYLYGTKGQFGDEELTVLGEIDGEMGKGILSFPSNSYAITKTSQNKEYAWDFIKYHMTDSFIQENFIDNYSYGGNFPITKNGMEIYKKKAFEPQDNTYSQEYEDYTGYLYNTAYNDENGNDIMRDLGFMTDEIIAEVDNYINTAVFDPIYCGVYSSDSGIEGINTIYDIFNEETDRMINGEITPEDCAYLIQDRVSIYLSENFD